MNRKLWITLILLAVMFRNTPSALGATCEELYEELMGIHRQLPEALSGLLNLSPQLIRGEETPKWQDFEALQKILTSIRRAKTDLATEGRLSDLETQFARISASIRGNPQLLALRNASLGASPAKIYQPTEYELKKQFQSLLYQINKELPEDLRIPGVRIPYDSLRTVLLDQARAMIKRQESEFEALFPSSGFSDIKSFEDAVRAQGGIVHELFEMIREERIEAVIRSPVAARWWVPRVGLHNQRITGSSQGTLSPEMRDEAEAFLSFTERKAYSDLDHDLKPKFGYLRPKRGGMLREDAQATSQYGEDFYIMKLDRLRDRLTWTLGDSLGNTVFVTNDSKPANWTQSFAPWKYRTLMVPYFHIDASIPSKLFKIGIPIFDRDKPLSGFQRHLGKDQRYLELQFWGPVRLDDVETFEFTSSPPEPEFYRELLKRGIKVRDARGSSSVDWAPSASERGGL